MKNGKYELDIYQIGYKQNDAFTAYVDMGSPKQLTRSQVNALKAISTGAPTSRARCRSRTAGSLVRCRSGPMTSSNSS
jgi:xylan 1,4-beta-xylosidase